MKLWSKNCQIGGKSIDLLRLGSKRCQSRDKRMIERLENLSVYFAVFESSHFFVIYWDKKFTRRQLTIKPVAILSFFGWGVRALDDCSKLRLSGGKNNVYNQCHLFAFVASVYFRNWMCLWIKLIVCLLFIRIFCSFLFFSFIFVVFVV